MAKSSAAKLKWQAQYNSRPAEIRKRILNNAARAEAIKRGSVQVGDNKDVAHVKALENGGGNTPGNTKVQSEKANRGWRKGKSGYNP